MSLQEAHDCLERRPVKGCNGCKYNDEVCNCYNKAMEIGAMAINYLMVGDKLTKEAESKE